MNHILQPPLENRVFNCLKIANRPVTALFVAKFVFGSSPLSATAASVNPTLYKLLKDGYVHQHIEVGLNKPLWFVDNNTPPPRILLPDATVVTKNTRGKKRSLFFL